MVDYVNKGKNYKTKPIDCSKLPFGILCYSSYRDLEKMRTVSSIVEKNEYKLLGTRSKKMVNALRLLKVPLFMGF